MTSYVVNVSLMCALALRAIRMIIVALCFECRLSLQLGVAELQAKFFPGFDYLRDALACSRS